MFYLTTVFYRIRYALIVELYDIFTTYSGARSGSNKFHICWENNFNHQHLVCFFHLEFIGICVVPRLRQRPGRHAGAWHCAEGSQHPLGRYCGSSWGTQYTAWCADPGFEKSAPV